MSAPTVDFLAFGHDTVEAAYYLRANSASGIDFERLMLLREEARAAKSKEPQVVILGAKEFLLEPNGSKSGYPFILNNRQFSIQCGPYNNPSFFVKFRSEGLWQQGAAALHEKFAAWTASLGFEALKPETLSRVDFTFDYHLPSVDFDVDSFVTLASKDSKYRHDGQARGFTFGKGDISLRVYDKVAEIVEQSGKVWFYQRWGRSSDVWRVEWQARKDILRRFGIRTFTDLEDQQGDLLRYLAREHDSLRVPNADGNRSRWPVHRLWIDLQAQIENLGSLGVYRALDAGAELEERLTRMLISINGYLKRIAAIRCLQQDTPFMSQPSAVEELRRLLVTVHDPLDWRQDVKKRMKHMQLGRW